MSVICTGCSDGRVGCATTQSKLCRPRRTALWPVSRLLCWPTASPLRPKQTHPNPTTGLLSKLGSCCLSQRCVGWHLQPGVEQGRQLAQNPEGVESKARHAGLLSVVDARICIPKLPLPCSPPLAHQWCSAGTTRPPGSGQCWCAMARSIARTRSGYRAPAGGAIQGGATGELRAELAGYSKATNLAMCILTDASQQQATRHRGRSQAACKAAITTPHLQQGGLAH